MSFVVIKDLPSKELLPGITLRSAYLENVMTTFVELKEGAIIPPHAHPHEQMSLLISGRLKFVLEGEEREVGPGEAVLIPSNVKHAVTVTQGPVLVYDVFSPIRKDYILDGKG